MNIWPLIPDILPYPPAMSLDARIYGAGHGGLVGSALQRVLQSQGYRHLITRSIEKRTDENDDRTSR